MARDWMKTLRRASFRGVSFHVESDTDDGGKRLGLHEYAGGTSTLAEEMGVKTERISVTAYLTTDTADSRAAALRIACLAGGPGLLILPMDAPRLVHVEDFSRLRERDRLGYVAFGITAIPAGGTGIAALGLGDLAGAFTSGLGAAASAFARMF